MNIVMSRPVLHSCGKPRELGAVKVVAFYDSQTGDIVHMHTAATLKGGREVTDEEAIKQARNQASRAGLDLSNLAFKLSLNPDHALRPHHIIVTSGAFVALPRPNIRPQAPPPKTPKRPGWITKLKILALLLCSTGGAFVGTYKGQDVNFDQLNYHYYIPYALIHWRIVTDIAPAPVIHNFFNPLIYVPFYALTQFVGPFLTSAALGALQGIALWLAGCIAWVLTSREPLGTRLGLVLGAVIISAASPMTLSEYGTSFSDSLTAVLVLAGLLMLIAHNVSGISRLWRWRYGGAGCLIGLAIGLKLTNGIYGVALLVAALLCGSPWTRRLQQSVLVGIGSLTGFLITGGYWCLVLWRRFGNPIFPYYNTIFKSPDFPLTSNIDHRYLPANLVDGILYPFRWCVGIVPLPEIGFRDLRFGVIFGAMLLVAILCVIRLLLGKAQTPEKRLAVDLPWVAPSLNVIVFFTMSFVIWIRLFAVQRYIVVLELLCGPIVIILLRYLARQSLKVLVMWVFALCVVWTVTIPDWGHIPWIPDRYGIRVPEKLTHGGIVFLAEAPISYVAPFFGSQGRFVGIIDFYEEGANLKNNRFVHRIKEAIADHRNPQLIVVGLKPYTAALRRTLGSYGLELTGDCQQIQGYTYTGALTACKLMKTDDSGPLAAFVDSGRTVDFDKPEEGFALLQGEWDHNWEMPNGEALAGNGYKPALFFKLGQGFASAYVKLRLEVDLRGDSRKPAIVDIMANGASVGQVANEGGGTRVKAEVCFPFPAKPEDRRVTIMFANANEESLTGGLAPAITIHLRSIELESAGGMACAGSTRRRNDPASY